MPEQRPDLHSAALLDEFVREWADLAERAVELRVRPSAANIVVEIADDLERRSLLGHAAGLSVSDKHLVARLRPVLADASVPEIAALHIEHRDQLTRLGDLLADSAASTDDLRTVVDPLRNAINFPYGWIARWLHSWIPTASRELAEGSDPDLALLYAVAALGVRATVPLVKRGDAGKWLAKQLGAGAGALVESDFRLIANEPETAAEMARWRAHTARRIAAGSFADGVSKAIDFFPTFDWVSLALAEADREASPERVASRLEADCIEFLVMRALYNALTPVIGKVEAFRTEGWRAISAGARLLLKARQGKGVIPDSGRYELQRVVADAVRTVFIRDIAALTAEIVANSNVVAVEALRRCMVVLVQDHREVRSDAISPVADPVKQAAIRSTLAEMTGFVDRALHEALGQAVAASHWQPNRDWFEHSLRTHAETNEKLWRDLAWERVGADQLLTIVTPIRQAFGAVRAFDVYLDVLDVEPRGEQWRCGPLLCYDAQKVDFGEGATGLRLSTDPTLRIRQRVVARSEHHAREKARQVLGHFLDALSFGTSVNTSHGGLRPRTADFAYVVDVARDSSMFSTARERFDLSDKRTSGAALKEMSTAYGVLVERLARGVPLSDLEDRALRALFWYRSGRWQPDPVRRFLDHAVALEHLFARDQPRGKTLSVARGVDRLFQSWQFRPFPFSAQLNRTLDEARLLYQELLINPALADRVRRAASDTDRHFSLRSVMNPRGVAAALAEAKNEPDAARWRRHLMEVQQLTATEPDWEAHDRMRGEYKAFAVQLLFRRRHRIVHEAITSAPGIAWDADALTEILESLLRIVVTVLIESPDPALLGMKDVDRFLSVPWD
jgi:hypothetical protein